MDYPRLFITDYGGGGHVVYSSGNSAQLPPGTMKICYNDAVSKTGTSDLSVKIIFPDYISPIDEENRGCPLVVMDQDIRQNHLQILRVLTNITNGCVTENDARFSASRCHDVLSEEEQSRFTNAIHIVPTWIQTHKIVFHYLMKNVNTPICKNYCIV